MVTAKKTAAKKTTKSQAKKVNDKDIFSNLKEEILSEVNPILKTLNFPKIKEEVLKDFSKSLDKEFSKIKSEVSSVSKKNILDIEKKLKLTISDNKELKQSLSKIEKSIEGHLDSHLDQLVSTRVAKALDSSIALHKKSENDIMNLKKEFNKLNNSVSEFEESSSTNIREEERKQAQFIVDKVNEVVTMVNSFETEFSNGQKKIFKNLEFSIEEQFDTVEKKIRQELLHRIDIELKANYQELDKKESGFEKHVESFKKDISKHVKEYVTSIDKELKVLKQRESVFAKAEKDFISKVEKRINLDVSKLEGELLIFRKEIDVLMSKLNSKKEKKVLNDEISESLRKARNIMQSEFDSEMQRVNEQVTRISIESKQEVKDLTDKIENSLFNEVNKVSKKFDDFGLKLEKEAKLLDLDREGLANERTNINDKVSNLISGSKEQIKTEISKFRENSKNLKQTVSDQISKKLDTQLEKFQNKISKVEDKISDKFKLVDEERKFLLDEREKVEKNVLELISTAKSEVEMTIANQIAINSDHISKLEVENRSKIDTLRNEIEEKLSFSTEQFKADYDLHLEKFDTELKQKESDFINKLQVVEDEKNQALMDLAEFKKDISQLTKDYVSELDSQLDKVKTEERKFETEKEVFIGELEESTKARKLELDDFANSLKTQVSELILFEKDKFDKSDETFRSLFNEKISNLQDFSKKKLESIEKKFVDKNLKLVENRVEQSLDALKIVEEGIDAKVDTFSKRIEEISNKEDNFEARINAFETGLMGRFEERFMSAEQNFNSRALVVEKDAKELIDELSSRERNFAEDFHELQNNVNERAEERIMSLEQSINKRFLDVENDFTNFKGLVIDEVEDLMKEVKELVSNKMNDVDRNLNKINFAGSEVVKRIRDFDQLSGQVHKEISFVRDDINNLRVRQDVIPHQDVDSTNIVKNMNDYEQNLVHLIESLKSRGISNTDILNTLVSKGHPRFYVSMIIKSL